MEFHLFYYQIINHILNKKINNFINNLSIIYIWNFINFVNNITLYKIIVQKIKIYECKLVKWLVVKIEFEEKKEFCTYNYMLLNQFCNRDRVLILT